MCGIAYEENFNGEPVNDDILNIFDAQRKRGTEGFGLFNGEFLVHAAKEDRILNWLCKYDSPLILFHHRWPTSTINVKKAAHPFTTHKYFGKTQYILVHNGSVDNASELFIDHQKLGIDYKSLLPDHTFNDSESFLWDFALYMEGKQKELTAVGATAFIVIKKIGNKLDKLYFGRNYARPLNMIRDKEKLVISSEGPGEEVDMHTMYTWNYKLKRLTKRKLFFHSVPLSTYVYDGKFAASPLGSAYRPWDDYEWEDDYKASENNVWGDWVTPEMKKKYGLDKPTGQLSYHTWTDKEVEAEAMNYIYAAGGKFEKAYWNLEADYYEELGWADRDGDYTHVFLIEKVMAYINADPEYIGSNSISSLWEKSWEQPKLITA